MSSKKVKGRLERRPVFSNAKKATLVMLAMAILGIIMGTLSSAALNYGYETLAVALSGGFVFMFICSIVMVVMQLQAAWKQVRTNNRPR